MRYLDYCCIQELSLSGGREIIRRTVGNPNSRNDQIDENWENKLVGEISEVRPERLEDSRIAMKNLGENSRYARSGATPLQQYWVFQIWSNTAAKGLFTGHFFRNIPDVEQHRFYGTAYGSIRSEQVVNAFQIWSNTPTICGIVRSQESIIPIENTAATGRCTGQFVSFYVLLLVRYVFFCVAFIL